jgi:hypothetical protein
MSRVRSILMILSLAAPLAQSPAAAYADGSRETVWTAHYDGAGLKDVGHSVAVSPDGSRVFVTGLSNHSYGSTSITTIAYDAPTGAQLWISSYTGYGEAVAVAPDGGLVYVAGFGSQGYVILAYGATTGTLAWVTTYLGPDHVAGLEISPDGTKVVVTGDDLNEWQTVAFDAATGHQLWATHYPCRGFEPCVAHGVAFSPDETRVYVTGDYWSGRSQDDATIAYDADTGLPVWTSIYRGSGDSYDLVRAIGVSPDGTRVFVTGVSSPGSHAAYVTFGYDAGTGNLLWLTRYDNQGTGGHAANDLGVSPDGSRVYVTGVSWGTGSNDFATIAYDPLTGAQLWVARYDGPAHGLDSAQALDVGLDGSQVFVTGWSEGVGTNLDFALVGYDAATGTQAWVVRYDGGNSGPDKAVDVASSPDGTGVFATGLSRGEGNHDDYTTVGRIG